VVTLKNLIQAIYEDESYPQAVNKVVDNFFLKIFSQKVLTFKSQSFIIKLQGKQIIKGAKIC
jgi:hypothetical protein